MKRLLFLLCFCAYNTFAQDITSVDSILTTVNLDDSSHIHRIVRALELSKIIEYEKGEARCYHFLGYIYNIKGNFPLSMEKYLMAEQLYKNIGDNEKMAHVNINVAYLYDRLKDYEKEIAASKKAISLTKLDSMKAYGYNCMGRAEMVMGNIAESIKNFNKAIEIKEQTGDANDIHDFLNSMGNAFIKAKMYDSAIATFWRIQRYAHGSTKILSRMYNNIGVCHHFKGQKQFAELNYLESIILDVKSESGGACLNYAELLYQMGQPEKAKSYLAKGLSYDYDLGHLGRTLHAMRMFEQSSIVRDCLYVHATKDFEKLRSNSVSIAVIESDLRNAREQSALKEANEWKGKMLWTWLAISVVAAIAVGKYMWDFYNERKTNRGVAQNLDRILNYKKD
jgi:tetratricopeptide (TPR) repeat protein